MATKTTKKPKDASSTKHPTKEYIDLRNGIVRYVNREVVRRINLLDQRLDDGVSAHIALTNEVETLSTKHNVLVRDVKALHTKMELLDDRQGDAANSSRAMYLNLKKINEQLDMFGHDISNLFAAHGDLPGVEKLIKEHEAAPKKAEKERTLEEVLTEAKKLVQLGWCKGAPARKSGGGHTYTADIEAMEWSAHGALIVAARQDHRLLDAAVTSLYTVVRFIWPVKDPYAPDELNYNNMCSRLDEWNDGMVKDANEVILAFNLAIKRCSL
jgi:hypothetical protein